MRSRLTSLRTKCAVAVLTFGVVACRPAQAEKATLAVAVPDASVAWAPPSNLVDDVTAQDYLAPPLPKGRVRLTDAEGKSIWLDVEVAATRAMRTRGMMWRVTLAEGKGMLFLFKKEEPLSFWMRNTLIPLDMVFIDSRLKVAGIVENAEPRTLNGRSPGKPAQFVLELPGGYTRKMRIKPGSPVELEGVGLIPVEP